MEPNDPFASMVELCRVWASQELQSHLPRSDQDSEDDSEDSGEITVELTTELPSGTDDDGDDEEEVNQNPIEDDNAFLFHTPPEFSSSVSDSEVFHTPRRASSSSLPSSQNQEALPEGLGDGGVEHDEHRTESAGDNDDEEEETVGIAVDLGADSDLGFSLAAESESADRMGSNSFVEVPDAVDRGPEIKVIRSESVKSRVSEAESVLIPDRNSNNNSGLTRDMRIQKLKESLDRLNCISEKQKRWKNNPVVETPEASLCPELSIIDSSMKKSGSAKHNLLSLSMNVLEDAPRDSLEVSLFPELSTPDRSVKKSGSSTCELVSLGMNMIQDAPRDSPEATGIVEMNRFAMIEDIPAGMRVDDSGQSHGVKRKLEFFFSEEMESDREGTSSGKEHKATKGTSCPELSSLAKSMEKSGSPKCESVSLSTNVIQDAPIDCSKAIGTLEINNHSMIEVIPAEMQVDDNGKVHGGKRKLEFLTEETESVSEENNSGKEHKGTKGTHDVVEKLSLPQGTSAAGEKNAKPRKKVSALVGFGILECLKVFAENTDRDDPKLESMSLVDIAKMRGMTFP